MTDGRRFALPDWGADHLSLDAVVAYVDDELDAGAHGRADAHLAGCAPCRAEVVAQHQARTALRAAAGPCLPSSLLHTLRAIPAETELPPPPPGLGVTADGRFVLLRDVPPDGGRPAEHPSRAGRRLSRRARLGAVSGLAVGALAVGALVAPGPAGSPGVPGGPVLNAPVPATAGSDARGSGELAARLDVGPAPLPATARPPGDAQPGRSPAVLDAALRQRLDRTPAAFHHRP